MSFESHAEQQEQRKLSLLEDFDACIKAVVAVEAGYTGGRELNIREQSILRQMMGEALGSLQEQLERLSEAEREVFLKKTVTGFQGLGGFNRYEVKGDGTLLLSRRHTVEECRRIALASGIGITPY